MVEIERLDTLAADAGIVQDVFVRLTVGVEAHTHEFISTAHEDQKFGLSIASGPVWRTRCSASRSSARRPNSVNSWRRAGSAASTPRSKWSDVMMWSSELVRAIPAARSSVRAAAGPNGTSAPLPAYGGKLG